MKAAIDGRIERLQALVGCITHARLLRQRRPREVAVDPVLSVRGARISGVGGVSGLSLDVTITLRGGLGQRDDAPRRVVAAAYTYALRDRNGTELLAYHWHPGDDFLGPDDPHVHVSAALRPALPNGDRAVLPLDMLHLATGAVSLTAFVRMLIEEFGARPLADDWRDRLDATAALGHI